MPRATLQGWVERGMAFPDREPWGSFSRDYRLAERGLALSIAKTSAMRVQAVHESMDAFMRWMRAGGKGEPPSMPSVSDMLWMDRLREARHPEDYGASKHREPEATFDGQHWLDAHAMDREQLRALFADPPEVIRLALTDAGWTPARKAEDETVATENIR